MDLSLEKKPVLLCCDIQERLYPHMAQKELLLIQATKLVSSAGRMGLRILVSEQYPKGLGVTIHNLGLDAFEEEEKVKVVGCVSDKAEHDDGSKSIEVKKQQETSHTTAGGRSAPLSVSSSVIIRYEKTHFGMVPPSSSSTPASSTSISSASATTSTTEISEIFKQIIDDQVPVILFGVEAHVCILQTVNELRKSGVPVYVAQDAVSSMDQEHCSSALQTMRQLGAFVLPTDSILFMLVGDCKSVFFKPISTLVKQASQATRSIVEENK